MTPALQVYAGARGMASDPGWVGYLLVLVLLFVAFKFIGNLFTPKSDAISKAVVGLGVAIFLFVSINVLFNDNSRNEKILPKIESNIHLNQNSNRDNDKIQRRPVKSAEKNYLQIEKPLIAKLNQGEKLMVVNVALMTTYDERVFENIKKHEHSLRNLMIEIMKTRTEQDMVARDARKQLALDMLNAINKELEFKEKFGGVDDVFFTSFVVQ